MKLTIDEYSMIKELFQQRLDLYKNTVFINELIDYANKLGATIQKTKVLKKFLFAEMVVVPHKHRI